MFGSEKEASAEPAPVQVVASPENPEEIALAETSTPVPTVLAQSASAPEKPAQAEEPDVLTEDQSPPVPADINPDITTDNVAVKHAPWWAYIVSNPKSSLFYTYFIIAIYLALLLGWFTDWEFHRHHWKHATEASVLIGLMSALFVVSEYFFFVDPVIAAVT